MNKNSNDKRSMQDGSREVFGVGRNSSGELCPETIGVTHLKFAKLKIAPNVIKAICGYTFTAFLTGTVNE